MNEEKKNERKEKYDEEKKQLRLKENEIKKKTKKNKKIMIKKRISYSLREKWGRWENKGREVIRVREGKGWWVGACERQVLGSEGKQGKGERLKGKALR